MRFNIDDLKRGNVGKARIDEVVLKTIYKVDEKFAKREDILRSSLPIVDFLQKQFIFKKAEGDDKETVEEKMYFKKNMDILKFFNKIALANIQLLQYEAILAETKKQEQQKAYMHNMSRLAKDLADKIITDSDYQLQVSQLQAEQYRALLAQRDQTLGRIGELLGHRDNIFKSITQHEENIRESREFHANEALNYVDQIEVDGVKVFGGMSQEQKENFVDGLFTIEEIKARQLMEIDAQINAEEIRLAESAGGESNGMMLQFDRSKRTSPLLEKLKARKNEVLKDADQLIDRLGDANGHQHINTKVPKDKRDASLKSIKSHKEFGGNLAAHLSDAKQEYEAIRQEQQALQAIDAQLNNALNQLREVHSSLASSVPVNVSPAKINEMIKKDSELLKCQGLENGFDLLSKINLDLREGELKNTIKLEAKEFKKEKHDLIGVSLSELDFSSKGKIISQDSQARRPERASGHIR